MIVYEPATEEFGFDRHYPWALFLSQSSDRGNS